MSAPPTRCQPSTEHSPLPWIVEPDEREGYEWNIHIVERTDQTNYDPNHPGKVYSEGLVAPVDIPMMGHLPEDHRPLQLFTKHPGD